MSVVVESENHYFFKSSILSLSITKMRTSYLNVTSVLFTIFISIVSLFLRPINSETFSPKWSVCKYAIGTDDCRNGNARADGTFAHLNATSVSVEGMWIFYADDDYDDPSLAEFVFQEKFGAYQPLAQETAGKILRLNAIGDPARYDYKTSSITVFKQTHLLTASVSALFTNTGGPGDCWPYGSASLVISGNEPWELILKNGSSECIVVRDRESFVPGIIRDFNSIGIQHQEICAFAPGCSNNASKLHLVSNNETQGVLKR